MIERFEDHLQQLLKTIIIAVVIGIFVYIGWQYHNQENSKYSWRGTFYEIVGNTKEIKDSGFFRTVDDCRAWANDKAKEAGYSGKDWDYSCGSDCKYKEEKRDDVSGRRVEDYECNIFTK